MLFIINPNDLGNTDIKGFRLIEAKEVSPTIFLEDMLQGKVADKVMLMTSDVEQTFQSFKSHFEYIEAAGGLVLNSNKEVLWMKRLGVWDLPKGKVEIGEDYPIAAVREVEEETGISNPVIERELISTYHTYPFKGKQVLKRTYWYLMNYSGEDDLIPQTEEGIEEVLWSSESSLFIENTYQNIIDVYQSKFS